MPSRPASKPVRSVVMLFSVTSVLACANGKVDTGAGGESGGGTGGEGTASAGGHTGTGGATTGGTGGAMTGGTGGAGVGGAATGGAGGARVDAGVDRGTVVVDARTDASTTLVPPVWSKNIRINDDTGTGNQSEVTMAAGPNGLVLTGWMDSRSTRVCAFSSSTDGGLTWSKNVSIPNNTGMFVGDPAVAIDGGGTMYAVCQEYLNVGVTGNIRMMKSTDRGVTWSAIQTIQSAPDKPWAGGGTADGTVFVSWLGNAAGIKRSLDHGVTWGPIQALGNIIDGTGITA